MFDNGKSAMCFNTTPALPNSQSKLGADNVGYMVMPTFGTGSMAGIPILDTQGFGIPTKAKDPQSAAAFIDFMHTPGEPAGDVDDLASRCRPTRGSTPA